MDEDSLMLARIKKGESKSWRELRLKRKNI
jgi:hypothetical protein